jgi:hypothetical protein
MYGFLLDVNKEDFTIIGLDAIPNPSAISEVEGATVIDMDEVDYFFTKRIRLVEMVYGITPDLSPMLQPDTYRVVSFYRDKVLPAIIRRSKPKAKKIVKKKVTKKSAKHPAHTDTIG